MKNAKITHKLQDRIIQASEVRDDYMLYYNNIFHTTQTLHCYELRSSVRRILLEIV